MMNQQIHNNSLFFLIFWSGFWHLAQFRLVTIMVTDRSGGNVYIASTLIRAIGSRRTSKYSITNI